MIVMSVVPIVCDTSARWLFSGTESTCDCAAQTAGASAVKRHLTRIGRHPVHLPSLSAVDGKGLLEVRGCRADIGPHAPHHDGSSVIRLLVVKLAAPILEFADARLAQFALAAVGEVETPLVRLRVVETERENLEVPAGPVDLELTDVRATIPNAMHRVRAGVFNPATRSRKRMLQAPDMRPPRADIEIEVVLVRGVRRDRPRGGRQRGDPVRLPRLAAITRECLLEVVRAGRHVGELIPDQNRTIVER